MVFLPFVSGTHQAMNKKKKAAVPANTKYIFPFPSFSFAMGKNWATINVAIQFAAKAQLCVAPIASGPTSSLERMNGKGPRPKAKLATKDRTVMAERIGRACLMPIARRTDDAPMPAMEPRRHILRPRMSASGAQPSVTTMLRIETKILSRAEFDLSRSASRLTPYIIMLLMPISFVLSERELISPDKASARHFSLIKTYRIAVGQA